LSAAGIRILLDRMRGHPASLVVGAERSRRRIEAADLVAALTPFDLLTCCYFSGVSVIARSFRLVEMQQPSSVWRSWPVSRASAYPEGRDDIIERSAAGHGVGLPDQRLEVARSADFLMLERRPDRRATRPLHSPF
jgi:hypothetical protein